MNADRRVSLAGGFESVAKKPSKTVRRGNRPGGACPAHGSGRDGQADRNGPRTVQLTRAVRPAITS